MDNFWYEDPSILFERSRLIEFFPSEKQSLYEKYNSIVRLTLYITILLSLYNQNIKYMSILLLVLLLTYYLYKFDTKIEKMSDVNEKCYEPTLNNPFMNVNYTEFDEMGNLNRPPACNPENIDTKKQIDEYFHNNIYRDTSDVFGKMNSQRQFFTMPFTTVPNDPNGEFKNWLYNNPKTCKEDQDYCSGRNEDVRRNFKRN